MAGFEPKMIVSEYDANTTRQLHAGAPWTGSPGCKRLYRGHFYGFRRDVMRRVRESPTDKDEYTTVDLCSSDFFSLASWGQLGEKGPIFA